MSRQFHGFVSRFAAGPRGMPAAPVLTTALLRCGVSTVGAAQLLAGEAVTAPADRQALVGVVADILTLAGEDTQAGLLLPAIQAVRAAAERRPASSGSPAEPPRLTSVQMADLHQLGLSAPGAQQVAAATLVTDAHDRRVVADLLGATGGTAH